MSVSDTPTPEDELREQLTELIDNRRFDDDYQGGSHANNAYAVKILLPFIHQQRRQAVEEVLGRLEKDWFWFNYAQPNLDKNNHKCVLLSAIQAERKKL